MSGTQPSAPRLFQLALAHYQAGRLREAEVFSRQVLALAPRHHDSLNMLGEIAGQYGHNDAALALIGDAIKLKPSEFRYYYNFGTILLKAGHFEESITYFRKALRKKPDFAPAHGNLAGALFQLGQLDQALVSCRAALRADRNSAHAHLNMGDILQQQGHVEAAIASYREALRLNPALTNIHVNLSNALRLLGQLNEAEALCHEAIHIEPRNMEARYALGYLQLLTGRLQEGWQGFDARRHLGRMNPLLLSQPMWDGNPAGNPRILLHAEEGLGDTLQFCRFAPLLAERARIVFGVPQALVRLLTGLPGVEQIFTRDDPAPASDMHLPLLSASRVLGTTLETIPAAIPYLRADPNLVADWRGQLSGLPGLRVGVVWAGNPQQMNDRRRSIPFERLAALADMAGVSFVSLQKGGAASQAHAAQQGMALHDWTDRLGDFADTAALVEGLDLVIGVDTSVIHLAGALGKPVWLLNRFDTDWRWLLDRDDSPWYPTLRQFRQPQPGDWDSVVRAVRGALEHLAAGGEAPGLREPG